jgi:hypothetical protein
LHDLEGFDLDIVRGGDWTHTNRYTQTL